MGLYQAGYDVTGVDNLDVPHSAKFLDVQMQADKVCAWFEVNPPNLKEQRHFQIVGTGQSFEGGKYLGTVQDKEFVWHLYEI